MTNKQLYKLSLGFVLIAISFCFYLFQDNTIGNTDISIESEEAEEEMPSEIYVDISGEVITPGVYKLPYDARVFEVINQAGGLTDYANIDVINVVEILSDENKIFIPSQDESGCITGLIPINDISDSSDSIQVSVMGEVTVPSVVIMNPDNRVNDAVDAAGGPTSEADMDRVNLAEKLIDEMNIYIPKKGQNDTELGKVNINTATKFELQQLSGIGEKLAEEIVNYRSNNGFFKKTEEVMKVPGIGQGKFENIKEEISIY